MGSLLVSCSEEKKGGSVHFRKFLSNILLIRNWNELVKCHECKKLFLVLSIDILRKWFDTGLMCFYSS